MKRVSSQVINFRAPIVILTALITLVLGFFLKDLKINADILSYLPKRDPVAQLNSYISDRYGGSQIALIGLETDELFSNATIETIHRLTEELQSIEGVQSVTSLTNVIDIRKVEDWVEVGKLIDPGRLPLSREELSSLKRYTLERDLFRGRIISENGRATLLVCRLREEADKPRIARQIRETVNRDQVGGKIYYAGLPFQITEITAIVLDDMKRLIPVAAVLIMLCLYLSFRSIRGVILPLLTAGISSIWTLGIMSLAKIPFSVITNIIPVVLLAVGSAYSIHVISMFAEESEGLMQDRRKHSALALGRIALPVTLAAVTTIAGFLSFIFGSYLTMIGEFGIFSGLGILFALILSLSFTPAVLSILPPEKAHRSRPGASKIQRNKGPLEVLGLFVAGRYRWIIAAGAALILIALIGIPAIVQEVDFISYFKGNTDIARSEEMIRKSFGGSMTLEVLVQGDIRDPAVLTAMKEMEEYLKSSLGLHNVYSIVELLEEMSFVLVDKRGLPTTNAQVGNLLFLLEGDESLSQLVSQDYTEGLIHATLGSQNTGDISRIVSSIQRTIDKANSKAASFHLAGSTAISDRVSEGIKKSQIQSLIIALALIYLCNLLLLRSPVAGLIGLTPILFSLFMLFGVMGAAGIPLDVATALIAGISLGVGIDYSIHFLNRFRRELLQTEDRALAVRATLATTGRAILINMTTVSIGLLSLLLGNLIPLRRFALLITVTMLGSGIGALTLLPAVILATPPRLFANKKPKGVTQ